MRIYLAGPMRGIPYFNFPAFHAAAKELRDAGHFVFSPAERDQREHGEGFGMDNITGDEKFAAATHGFSLRKALAEDLSWICLEADAIALLPGWGDSKGAKAEYRTALALGLMVIEL